MLALAALIAVLLGIAEAAGLSASGHAAVARFLGDQDQAAAVLAIAPWARLGAAVGIAIAARARLGRVLLEGLRAIARPALFSRSADGRDAATLFLAAGLAVPIALGLEPLVRTWERAPLPVALGLLATGCTLATTSMARGGRDGASLVGAVTAGMAFGLACFPGSSPIGIAAAVLLWQGVKPARAAELALLVVAPALAASAVAELAWRERARQPIETGLAVAVFVLAVVAAAPAAALFRRLVERRRLAWVAPWLVALGLATLAYAHASG